ncbi:MAG: GerAB/ArcD/ProY family transporter [Firmicutes bacterium]|nr:GerAB/ArcD/ProY family transporter [Bacillota bacterium]
MKTIINNPKDKISTGQAAVAVSSIIIGAGILVMTRPAVEIVNAPDVWLSVLLAGVFSIILGIISVKLSQRFPEKTFFQYNKIIVGKFFGWILSMITIIFYVIVAGFEARMLAELVRTYLLLRTPMEVIIITFICVGTYLTVGGINPIVRAFELYLSIIVFIFFSILLLGLQYFELDNLRPVLGKGVLPVIKGMKATLLSYIGFEIIMILTAFMKEPHKAVKAVVIGTGIPVLIYVVISIIVIGVLTVDEVKTLTWPLASLVNSIEYPGGFVENFQIFFLIIWVLAIYTTYVASHYVASLGMCQVFNKEFGTFVYALNPLIYIIALLPQNLKETFSLGDLIGYLGLIVAGIMPSLLYVIAFVRKKGWGKKENET